MRGIPHLIGSLETFLGVYSFFGDELHMLGHGIGHLISDLLDPSPRNKFKVADSIEYTFDVQEGWTLRSFMEAINRWIDESKPTTPTFLIFLSTIRSISSELSTGSIFFYMSHPLLSHLI